MPEERHDLGEELVKVAFAQDPAQGEMIQGLLESGGIPSLLRPTGLNGPLLGIGLLPPGSQRVMVRASQADAAQRLLAETLVEDEQAWPDTANASHLEDAAGKKPRGYGLSAPTRESTSGRSAPSSSLSESSCFCVLPKRAQLALP